MLCVPQTLLPLLRLGQVVPPHRVTFIPCRFLRPRLFSALLNVLSTVVPDLGSFEESPRFAPSFQTSSFSAVFVEKASSVKQSFLRLQCFFAAYMSVFSVYPSLTHLV